MAEDDSTDSSALVFDAATVERIGQDEFFRTLVANTSDGIVTIDETSTIVCANGAVRRIFGRAPADLIGDSLLTLIPDRLRQQHVEAVTNYLATGDRDLDWDYIELPGLHADGHEVSLAISFREHVEGDYRLFTGIIRDITERKAREREREQQRDELAELNRINAVIRDINRTLIGASTQDEIERTVCERLVESDVYDAAWIGESYDGTVRPRVWAGADGECPDGPPIAIADDEDRELPRRAVETGTVQMTRPSADRVGLAPPRAEGHRRGLRSALAVPLAYGKTVYGVLTVYSNRADGFNERERAVLAELGELVGHAISGIKSKKLLHADTVTEIEFRMPSSAVFFVDASPPSGATLAFEGGVPASGGFLYYVTATGARPADVLAAADDATNVEEASLVSENDDEGLFLIRTAGPSAITRLLEAGARIETAVADGDEAVVIAEIAPGTDARVVRDAVTQAIPDAELVAQREVERAVETRRQFTERIAERLTDRQRTALEAAYRGGYFARPRNISGNDLAASLGITASTFHQHLQTGLNKVAGAIFDDDPAE